MCGKNKGQRYFIEKYVGSPPRVREKPTCNCLLDVLDGITPACAGKTIYPFYFDFTIWDHPRVCGKNHELQHQCAGATGSPPRVREKPFACIDPKGFAGITPACAGKTGTTSAALNISWDHPPRVREKPARSHRLVVSRRITPACAGKTLQ